MAKKNDLAKRERKINMFNSILDNDQYTFTQQQAALKIGIASTPVESKFKCRTPNIDFSEIYCLILERIEALRSISLQKDEYDYLRSLRYFSEDYLPFLKMFRFTPDDFVSIKLLKTGELDLTIRSPLFFDFMYEIPLLYIISEAWASKYNIDIPFCLDRVKEKTNSLPIGFKFADFGTRRRASGYLQDQIVEYLSASCKDFFVGTSNVYLAKRHNIKSIGTMSHKWVQTHQQLQYRLEESQKMAFENWVAVYGEDLGIALSDTINTDAFLRDFDNPRFYKLFNGVREDSDPDPINFGHRIINFYREKHVDLQKKSIIFSNGLNFEKAKKIFGELHHLIPLSFGIGTNLTNDTGQNTKLDIVIKMTKCNRRPVAKISNEAGKTMCEDQGYYNYLKSVFNVQ
jgi:nicotinate phosphoribosyltransferase